MRTKPREMTDVISRFYPENEAGGFSRLDGTVQFYQRVRALLGPGHRILDFGAGAGLEKHPLITVYHSTRPGENTFVNVGWMGFLGLVSGMNEKRVAVSEIEAAWEGGIENLRRRRHHRRYSQEAGTNTPNSPIHHSRRLLP